jgi:acetyl-CoA carboxylase biotin carboxyl carrier protein
MDDKFFLSMVDKFNSSDIAELDFNDGSVRLTLRKNGSNFECADMGSREASSKTASAEQSVHLGISARASGAASGGGEKIKSPIVATYYSSPSPDAPAFVKPGTQVKKGQTLCILEAMKMMNNLEAEFDCEIVELHASSGQMIEYGQELFTVKRN